MPNIKPISDLRNYTTVINEVTYGIEFIIQETDIDSVQF